MFRNELISSFHIAVNFDMELRAKYYIANKIWISDSLETSVAIERITEAWHIDFTFLHVSVESACLYPVVNLLVTLFFSYAWFHVP